MPCGHWLQEALCVFVWDIRGHNRVGLNKANDKGPMTRTKRSVAGVYWVAVWKCYQKLQARTICYKSLPTDKPISCYLWKHNIYLEAMKLCIRASVQRLRGHCSTVSEARLRIWEVKHCWTISQVKSTVFILLWLLRKTFANSLKTKSQIL